MAAKLSQSLEEQVTCPICLEQYQDPRILPCLHTYCRKCLEDLLDKGNRRFSIQCPECRETFQIEDVNSLRVNIWVNRNIALLEMSTQSETGQKGEAVLMCDNDNCNVLAEARCFDCEISMCSSCIKAHNLMSKFTKDHHLMTLEDIKEKGVPTLEKATLCDKHKGKKQNLFCEDCETQICRDCTLIDHAGHKFAFIADVVEKHKCQLQKKMQHVCGTKKKIKSALKAVKDMQERVRKNEKKIKKEIDEKIDVKIAILEKMRAKLKQESTNLTATKMKRLSLQQDGLEMQLAGLTSAVEFTENILVKGSNNDVLSMKKQIESRLTELSDKEIDDEVDEEDKQILQQVNEILYSDLENYFVIKDASAPDRTKQKLFCEQCEKLISKDCALIDHTDHEFASIANVVEKHEEKLREGVNNAYFRNNCALANCYNIESLGKNGLCDKCFLGICNEVWDLQKRQQLPRKPQRQQPFLPTKTSPRKTTNFISTGLPCNSSGCLRFGKEDKQGYCHRCFEKHG